MVKKNGIFIVKNGLEDKKEFIQQYKNGALFNEFLNKQQFDDLKNEIEDQKYNRLHQQKEIFDKFFEDNKKIFEERKDLYNKIHDVFKKLN